MDETQARRAKPARVGRYTLGQTLGIGGMGEVYAAIDPGLGRRVAIKVLPAALSAHPELKERFRREAEATAALNHPNVVTIHELGEDGGRLYLVMEHVDGPTLKEVLERDEPIDADRRLGWARDVAEGLAAAHAAGIVHRDVKPANVMVDAGDRAKLLDFGLAKLGASSELTQAGRPLGTPLYMSPEQIRGEAVDERSDIFSFGLLLYELLSGSHPFRRDDEAATLYAIAHEAPAPCREAGALEPVVARALAKDPQDRYASVEALMAELGGAGSSGVRRSRRWRRRPGLMVAGALAVVLGVASQWVHLGGDRVGAAEPSLAVMYFENLADFGDAGKHGRMLSGLLTTDLSQSSSLKVTSRQRLLDCLRQVEGAEASVVDRTNASAVARHAGIRYMLSGEILQVAPWVVRTEISDADSGSIVAAQQVQNSGGADSVFAVASALSRAVQQDLAEMLGEVLEPAHASVSQVTTSSSAAYRHYVDGIDARENFFFSEARDDLLRAVELDSSFAMAHYALAQLGKDPAVHIARAVRHIDQASDVERRYILAEHAAIIGDLTGYQLQLAELLEHYPDEKRAHHLLGATARNSGDHDAAIGHLQQVILLDPFEYSAYNDLAYTYSAAGQFDKAIEAINKYIEGVPDQPNPYDSRGDIYARQGLWEEATASFRRALELKPGFTPAAFNLADAALLQGDFETFETTLQSLFMSPSVDVRALARGRLGVAALYRGQFTEGLRLLDEAIAADRLEGIENGPLIGMKQAVKAAVLEFQDRPGAAHVLWRDVVATWRRVAPHRIYHAEDRYAQALVADGKLNEATRVLDALAAHLELRQESRDFAVLAGRGFMARARGDHQQAIAFFEQANAKSSHPLTHVRFALGELYLIEGALGAAADQFVSIERTFDEGRTLSPIQSVLSSYYLGRVYEASGWHRRARAAYERFLAAWGAAEGPPAEVRDAEQRLAALQS